MASEFGDAVAQRKKAERKRRQQFLYEQITGYKMASFTFGEARWLNTFFDQDDPSDADLARATSIIERHIADIRRFWDTFNKGFPDGTS